MAATATVGALLWGWLWNERFWFPANVTWADLEREGPDGEGSYPRPVHLLVAFPLAVGFYVLRWLFESFIAKPCALRLGIQDSGPCRAQPSAILEKVYLSISKYPDARRLEGLSKQLDWDVRKIQRWFRHRRNQDKPRTLTKFCESMWRFIVYLSIFSYGFVFLWSSPWFWDTKQCWYNFPFQFTDVRRKDFLIMFIHHLTAVVLITTSYITNMVRVGVLILCLHDVSDSFLEVAKMANYAKYQRLCDATFILFTVMFIATRLGIFPIWILNTTLFESWEIIGPYPSWWFFNGFLLVLQLLHVVWSYFIICVAYKALARGKVLKDERSDVESSSEGEDGTSNSRKGILSTSSNGANRINGHIMNDQQTEEE
ncbi:ceramide synthase 5 isoform X2 [Hemicordylus capensis]|uniref:ceramide synthase 5 isoform X2 n=1 Tax=Hemicordylus capensis TaxID=884348 RepID=UPI0023045DE4|nr:ceramide synthase 5 isoform X2 [Hemicordylus capensis]